MDKKVYSEHRKALMNKIDNNSIVILFAGSAPKKTGDQVYKFTPDRNFYYLTGISEENHVVVLSKFNNEVSEKLFLKEIDLAKEMWNGKTLRDFEAKEISGIEDSVYMKEFYGYLNRLIKGADEVNVYLDLDKQSYEEKDLDGNKFAKTFKDKYPQVVIKNVSSKINPLRMIKSEEEVAEMQKAIDITIDGVKSLMKNAKAGMKEYELEAYFDFACKTKGVKDLGFRTIAAAGKNATILHYVENNSEITDKDLMI